MPLPGDRDACRGEDAEDRLGHFGTDAVTRDERDGMCSHAIASVSMIERWR